MADRPIAVTGPSGRLGRAVLAQLREHGHTTVAWGRPAYDLDDHAAADRVASRDRPSVVVHAAAWTDVDGCARDPGLALRRNAEAVGELAEACATSGCHLVLVSTNEVFDGRRTDGRGYGVEDDTRPINAYGASKLEGESRARAAFSAYAGVQHPVRLAIVRTSWLFGPPGDDFPTKIVAGARAAATRGEPLRVVDDEFGSPTSTTDLALAMAALIEADVPGGVHHWVNEGVTSRFGWAEVILRAAGVAVVVEPISSAAWTRASTPPAWGVLAPTPLPAGIRLPTWQAATDTYVASIAAAA